MQAEKKKPQGVEIDVPVIRLSGRSGVPMVKAVSGSVMDRAKALIATINAQPTHGHARPLLYSVQSGGVEVNVFFTEAGARQWIIDNQAELKDARLFVKLVPTNPEMALIMAVLQEFTGEVIKP